MDTGFLTPPADLEPFIERFWWCRSDPDERLPMPLLAPGVGTELFLHVDRAFVSNGVTAPSTHLLSVRTHPVDLAPQGDLDLVAIRFRAGAIRHFLPMPVQDLPEGILSAESVWGSSVTVLRERLGEAHDFQQRTHWLAAWCRDQYLHHSRPDEPLELALRRLYEAPGHADLEATMHGAGLGPRQFQRRFKAIMGTSPKRFQRLARFYQLVRRKALAPGGAYLAQALDLGFYDQPHVIHEFQELTGMSPGNFLRELARRTHFYNPPRRSGT